MRGISVILPVYNCENYLKRAIISVLNQTYQRFELIIIDDGSTDHSYEICNNYEQYQNVTIIHQNNLGLSAARNIGIMNAKYDLLFFIDSDDFIHPDCLKLLYNVYQKEQADIIVSNFKRTNNDCIDNIYSLNYYEVSIEYVLRQLCNHDHNAFQYMTSWGILFHKRLFNECLYPVGKFWEDVFIAYKLYDQANKIITLDVVLYYYFENTNSITQSPLSLRNLDWLEGLEKLYVYIKNKHPLIMNEALLNLLNKAYDFYLLAKERGDMFLVDVYRTKYLILYQQYFFKSIRFNQHTQYYFQLKYFY